MEDLEVIDVEDVISVDNSFTDEVSVDELFTEDINVEDTIEDIVETEINVVEELLVDDDVHVSDAVIDDLPNIIEGGQIYIYMPIASANNKGIAEFNKEHFTVIDGVVYIKLSPKAIADQLGNNIVDTYQRKDNMINQWITDLLDNQYPSAKLVKTTLDKISYDKGKAIFVFNTKEDFVNWLDGKLETDINGKTITDLAVGDDVFVLDLPANYWCKKLSNPLTLDDFVSYADLSMLDGLKSEWGNIEGDINNQTDLMELVNNIKEEIPKTGQDIVLADDNEGTVTDAIINTNRRVDTLVEDVAKDLLNYFTKDETYSREEINERISSIPKFGLEVVQELPTENISNTTVYLVPSGSETDNLYIEYIYVNNSWEKLGEQKLDLSNYINFDYIPKISWTALQPLNATVSIKNFTLTAGATILVYVNNVYNLGTGTRTLNINGTGAKQIYKNNSPVTNTNYLNKGWHLLYYNGTRWYTGTSVPLSVNYATSAGSSNSATWTERIRRPSTLKTTETLSNYNIVVANSEGGYFNLKTGNVFDITQPIYVYYSNYPYLTYNVSISYTQDITLTDELPIYIKGTLNGTLFTPISTTPLTQTIPTEEDGYQYILLGSASSTTTLYLQTNHPIYEFKNGVFGLYGGSGGSKITWEVWE